MGLLQVGEKAPDFQLPNQDNQLISLGQFKGKWVITYFYPKAMTPGCTVQACGLRDAMKALQKKGAIVLGISPDKPAALAKFAQAESLNFQLLGDTTHKVAEQYGTWQEKSMYGKTYMGMARVTYLIDLEGKIAHIMPKVDTKTHADDMLALLEEHA